MKEKSNKEYFNEVSKKYTFFKKEDRNLKILQSLKLKPKSKILLLGCGGGREVKFLSSQGHNLVAIDFAENMIREAKKMEPRATYYCADAVKFAKENTSLKFDYILGLFSFFNYISKKDRKNFLKNLLNMLNKNGKIIFEIRYVGESLKEVAHILLSLFYARIYKRSFEWGDFYFIKHGNYTISHHYTKKQLKRLLEGRKYSINKNMIYITGV